MTDQTPAVALEEPNIDNPIVEPTPTPDPEPNLEDPQVDPVPSEDPPKESEPNDEPLKDEPPVEEPKEKDGDKNWRDDILKNSGLEGDELEAMKKRLDRYASPAAMAKGLMELNKKISNGDYKIPAPEDPEALARWRKDNGIPETKDGYEVELADGLVLGELDKPMVDGFLEVAHAKNLDGEVVNEVISWYKGQEKAVLDADLANMEEAKNTTVSELEGEWGQEYKGNMNAIAGLHDKIYGEELGPMMANAILPDGTPLGSHPEFLRAQAGLVRELNIGDLVVPGAINKMESIGDEMSAIEKTMGTKDYTSAKSARYLELTEAKIKLDDRRR